MPDNMPEPPQGVISPKAEFWDQGLMQLGYLTQPGGKIQGQIHVPNQ